MNKKHFLKHSILPFAELRYSRNSGRHYKPHMHKTFSVGAIEHGKVIYQVEGKAKTLQPGGLALINPETLHSCNPTGCSSRSYYMIHLDVDWCLQLQQSLWHIDAFRPVNTILLNDNLIYGQYISMMKSLMIEKDLLKNTLSSRPDIEHVGV